MGNKETGRLLTEPPSSGVVRPANGELGMLLPIPSTTESPLDIAKRLEIRAKAKKMKEANEAHDRIEVVEGARVDLTQMRSCQIPLWDNDERALLHDFARSALFTCRQKVKRDYFKKKEIIAASHLKLRYTGLELRQSDLDVYLQLLHLSRGKMIGPLGQFNPYLEFNGWQFIQSLGWARAPKNLEKLSQSLTNMVACAITLDRGPGKGGFKTSNLVVKFEHQIADQDIDDGSPNWKIVLNTDVANELKGGNFNRIDWPLRQKLPPLGKWLMGYYDSQKTVFPIHIDKLRELSGSVRDLKHFKLDLKKDLDILVRLGFLKSWNISPSLSLMVKLDPAANHSSQEVLPAIEVA